LVRAALLATGTWLGISALGRTVYAQSEEDMAGARAAATEGAQAFSEGHFKDAIDLFGRAESLVHAPPHLLYLARAHEKLGHLVKAHELYNKIVREKLSDSAPAAFKDAQQQAADAIQKVEPRLARLTIRVEGGAGKNAVKMDGEPVSAALVGVSRPVDPGAHTVEAVADGFRAAPQKVNLEEGGRATVTLKLAADPNAKLPQAEAAAGSSANGQASSSEPKDQMSAADRGPSGGNSGLRVPAYIALGVGAVGIGAGTVFAIQSAGKRKDADKLFQQCQSNGVGGTCREPDPLIEQIRSTDNDARSAQTIATIGFIAGGVGVAAGVTLMILSSSGGKESPQASIQPWIGYKSAGITGTF
jgi:hypothetical protein